MPNQLCVDKRIAFFTKQNLYKTAKTEIGLFGKQVIGSKGFFFLNYFSVQTLVGGSANFS